MNALFSPIDRAVDIRTLVRALLVLAPPFGGGAGHRRWYCHLWTAPAPQE